MRFWYFIHLYRPYFIHDLNVWPGRLCDCWENVEYNLEFEDSGYGIDSKLNLRFGVFCKLGNNEIAVIAGTVMVP